jgi:hypothetical protein
VSSSTDDLAARRRARRLAATALLAALASAAFGRAADLPPLAELRAVEFETALAKGKGIYLVLDPPAKRLTVKSRGLALDAVELDAIALLEFRSLLGRGDAPGLLAPTVWKVLAGPGDADRETIAPAELRPYGDEEDEEPETAPAAGSSAATKPKPEELEKPATYRVRLDNGWELLVTPQAPRGGFFRRLVAAVGYGWRRLQGTATDQPPLVALVMPAPSGRRLHHLFRTGTEILVLP